VSYTPFRPGQWGETWHFMPRATNRSRRLALWIPVVLALAGAIPPVGAADIEFVTLDLPWAIADKPYAPPPLQVRSSGSCGHGGVGYTVIGGVLPPGLELSKSGYFSGSPVRTGDFGFGVRVSNGCTWTVKRFVLTVTGAPVITISPELLIFTGAGEKTVRVSSTWPRLSYRAISSAGWLKIAPAHGFTPRPSSALTGDDAVISVDAAGLKPGHYSATIAVDAWEVLNAARLSVEFNVTELDVTATPAPSGTPTSASRP